MSRFARPGWLSPPVLGVSLLAVASGAAAFSVTASMGEVAIEFGAASSAEVENTIGMSAGTLGLGLAVIRLAGAGSLLGSAVADRLGRRRVLLAVTSVGLLLTLAATAAPSFWLFVAVIALARPLLSTNNSVTVVVAAEETGPRDRTAAIALVGASYAFGSGLVSVVRPALEGLGFRALLVGVGLSVVLVPLVARLVREPPVAAEAVAAGPVRPTLGTVPRAYLRPLVVLCVLSAGTNLVTGPAFTWLFVYGENVLGASPGDMALLVLAAGPVGLAGLVAGRTAADRLGRRGTAVVATVALAVASTTAYSADRTALAVGYLAAIASSAALGPAVGALLNESMPTEARATANGWAAATGVLGAVAGLVLFGVLSADGSDFASAARWLFLPLVVLAAGYLLLVETRGSHIEEVGPASTDPGDAAGA